MRRVEWSGIRRVEWSMGEEGGMERVKGGVQGTDRNEQRCARVWKGGNGVWERGTAGREG